jgi:hypothetical protein
MQGIDANQGANTGAGRFWRAMIRAGVLVAAGLALLTITLIGLFVVLPLVLVGSVALYLYVAAGCAEFRLRSALGTV